jgi:hypothetical protein
VLFEPLEPPAPIVTGTKEPVEKTSGVPPKFVRYPPAPPPPPTSFPPPPPPAITKYSRENVGIYAALPTSILLYFTKLVIPLRVSERIPIRNLLGCYFRAKCVEG